MIVQGVTTNVYVLFFRSFICIFAINREDTFTRFDKYSSKLNFVEFRPRSVEKISFLYILSLKLGISRSFIRIFAFIKRKIWEETNFQNGRLRL